MELCSSTKTVHLLWWLSFELCYLSLTADDPSIFNFDEVVARFIESKAQKNQEEVIWWDMHGENEHLKANAYKYSK